MVNSHSRAKHSPPPIVHTTAVSSRFSLQKHDFETLADGSDRSAKAALQILDTKASYVEYYLTVFFQAF
jgi:hypothetical protein